VAKNRLEVTSAQVVVEFPLRGEWVAVRTPAHKVPSHGTDLLGQRYAFDFVRADHRRGLHLHPAGTVRAALLGGRTRDYFGWGQPIHASFAGDVVVVVDRVPERARVHWARELVVALRNSIRFVPTQDAVNRVAGNHVIVRGAGVFALFAHLAPGTVSVEVGQPVEVGQVVGRVGHSGNSTAPHLHFQLMDSTDPMAAQGIPCAFAEYLVQRDQGWVRVEAGIPRRGERICSGRRPPGAS
jgi:hypothetical protein